MKNPNALKKDNTIQRMITQASRINVPPLAISLFAAILLSAYAGLIAVHLSQEYYSIAPHHYDSGSYRLWAYQFYNLFQSQGAFDALAQALQHKDPLDIILRLLLAPRLL